MGKLDKVGLFGKNLLQRKNDYKDGGIWYGLFLSPKIKFCLTLNKFGVIDQHVTFKSFTNESDNLNKKNFNKADGGKLFAKLPLSWEKSFSQGIVFPHKMKNFIDCKKLFYVMCDNCDK